ncbi:MAG: PAS domain S-box protein [Desulfobacteraceae bacterium]|nr:PAS domain S-box protein [Desulfobacteraceae bacterium]
MQLFPNYIRQKTIGIKILFLILLIGFLFAFAEAGILLYQDYKFELNLIESQIEQIQNSYLKSITKSTWNMEADEVAIQLEGVLHLKDIKHLEVVTEHGDILAAAGVKSVGNTISRTLKLEYQNYGKLNLIGELKVLASLEGIYNRLFKKFIVIIAVRLFIATLISIIFLFVFYRLVSRHLTTMADYTQNLDFNNLGNVLTLKRVSKKQKSFDELDKVVNAINEMQVQIQKHISEKEARKNELLKEKEFTDAALNSQNDTFFLFDPVKGKAIRWNKAFNEISGYTDEEIVKLSAPNSYYSDEDLKKAASFIENVLIKGSGRIELGLVCKNKKVVPTEYNVSLIRDDENNPKYIISIGRDITEQKLAQKEKNEAQLRASEQEKHAIVGKIAGKIAHDFNNILGAIMGNTELAKLDCTDASMMKVFELIHGQTIRGRNLTKNLIAFAKDQEPKQEFFSIREKTDLVISLLKKDLEGIEIIREIKAGIPDLLADPGMIEHALVNLIQNAVHAVSNSNNPKIKINISHKEESVNFYIEDNGCGILPEDIENIYDPTFSLKGTRDLKKSYKKGIRGSGYGMANVKKYIDQHKGTIHVESIFGSGTKFIISIPITQKELTVEDKKQINKSKSYKGKYVLLVEDEQAISEVQYRILTHEPCSHSVDVAANGSIAIDLFTRNNYDFVSLDYVLPGDLDGMDVYNHIRSVNNEVPILFVSGNIEFIESIKEFKKKDKNMAHVPKPCGNKDYINSINDLMDSCSSVM